MHIAQIEITYEPKFSIPLPSKITVLSGSSGSGKTWLCQLVPAWAQDNDIPLLMPKSQAELDLCITATDSLIVVDRADMYVLNLQAMMSDTNQYVLVGRTVKLMEGMSEILVVNEGPVIRGVAYD